VPVGQEVHYEVYRRQGSKGGWTLHEVSSARDGALRMAEELMAEQRATGVKVVKETYNAETGDYLSLKIFEDGHTKLKTDASEEDVPHALPCFKPDDLYSYHARATMTRLLHDFLARQKLTITELIHRADALERLEATGTLFQHCVQKIAVAQAASTSMPVSQIIKSLNELTEKALQRVYRDTRRKYFPVGQAGQFGALAEKLASESDGLYQFNGSLARYLGEAKNWNEKLVALLVLMDDLPAEGPGRTMLLSAIDTLVAELLNGSAALHELIGETENLGSALAVLVALFLGHQPEDQTKHKGLARLAEHFKKDGLPDARGAVARRITAELRSVRRLCPTSLVDELKLLRKIANKLVLGQGKYLSHEEIIAAFTLRSRRLVCAESIAEHLGEAKEQDEKVERLLLIEENIIGAENKRQLAGFIMPILTSAAFETYFVAGKTPPITRLRRLAELQLRVRRSGFQDKERQDICDVFDKIASEIELRTKMLAGLEKMPNPVERAVAALRLCTGGVLTEGRLSAKARAIVIASLSQPGFLTGYVAHISQGEEKTTAESAMSELLQTLEKAGITHETGLRAIAA
jgi:hypothetical protein